ncbi:antitermination protein Q [Pseudomonas typographi]|uniref:Antitermination protein Q n=1 Tax=Pseudomonas typographi TaxID=2715964 RepID=A0ABR7Z8U0_9PSED|nr:antitermination protein Q [Pseudomonas typographi]MBD1601969.1 antitermination protein Q [Pseudomonas typographi]
MSKRVNINKLSRPLGDTEYLLEQWGWWRMSGMGVPRYVSPSFAIMRDNVEQLTCKSFVIIDEVAMSVDSAVARLTLRNQMMGDMVWLYFGAKWPAVRVGKHFEMSEAKARELIKAGVAWVDSSLEMMRDAA